MSSFLRQAGILLLFLAICLRADDKKKPGYYLKAGQTTDLDVQKLTTAKQNCENWAVAAGLEDILKKQGVPFDQNFWVTRLSGSEVCIDNAPTMETVARAVNGEFVLDDRRHVRLELHYVSGAPSNVDEVVYGIQQKRISLLLLRGHPFYLTGVTYDEYIGRDGSRMFEIRELRLANTYAKLPGLAFQKGRDDPADINGMLTVVVNPV
jgi:hypothetical protein